MIDGDREERSPAQLDAFRSDVRRWIDAHAPPSLIGTRKGRFDGYWGGRKHPPIGGDVKAWLDANLERGWTAPTWPVEYGGGGLTRAEGDVLDQEMTARALPPPLAGFGLTMIGPTLLDFGSAEQKGEHLPKIVRGEVRWCQGYSEPGAGSDLASLQTRALLDGDEFVVNGQKIWTSFAHLSDWIFCLVRTDTRAPKQRGITFLLIDMLQPGVSVRPIELISGASPFCEVFFENVRVPAANVVGAVNGGWTVAKALMGYERSMIGVSIGGQLSGGEQELVALARAAAGAPNGPLPDAELRRRIIGYAMDETCFTLVTRRIQQRMQSGKPDDGESSILKICGSELKQTRWDLRMRIAREQALGWEGPGFTDAELQATREWLRSRANTIEGGTSEIQLNIIARRVLGLPGRD